MAINPIFGSQLPDLAGALGAQTSGQTSTGTPAVLTPQQLNGKAADLLLSDMNSNASTASTGDPLLDDLNAFDSGRQANNGTGIESSLSQNLNSFLLQQATASFQASQAMDNQQPSSGSNGSILGNTSA